MSKRLWVRELGRCNLRPRPPPLQPVLARSANFQRLPGSPFAFCPLPLANMVSNTYINSPHITHPDDTATSDQEETIVLRTVGRKEGGQRGEGGQEGRRRPTTFALHHLVTLVT